MKESLVSRFVKLQQTLSCDERLVVVAEQKWSLRTAQSWSHTAELSGHLLNFSTVLLYLIRLAWTQKGMADGPGNRPRNSHRDLPWMKHWLWKVLWSLIAVQLLSRVYWNIVKTYFASDITARLRSRSLLFRRRGVEVTTNQRYFFFSNSLCGTNLSIFFWVLQLSRVAGYCLGRYIQLYDRLANIFAWNTLD